MEETVSNKKKSSSKSSEKEMSFWEHLEELRWLLVRSVIAIAVTSILAFLARNIIFDKIILAPNRPGFPTYKVLCSLGKLLHVDGMCYEVIELKIINYNMAGQLMTHLNVSLVAGVIIAMPYILRETWRFLKPALKEKEKKYSIIAMSTAFVLFMTGILFGYFVIVPLTLYFFAHYIVSTTVENFIVLSSYISTVLYTTIAVGVVFLMPVFVLILVKLGVMSAGFLKRSRKASIIIVLVLATIIGPPDVASTVILSIPLYGLFELTVWVASKMEKKKETEEV